MDRSTSVGGLEDNKVENGVGVWMLILVGLVWIIRTILGGK